MGNKDSGMSWHLASIAKAEIEIAVGRGQLGALRLNQGKYDEAERHYRYAIGSFERIKEKYNYSLPQEVEAQYRSNLAFALLSQKKTGEAESEYRRALQLLEPDGNIRFATVVRSSLAYLLKQDGRLEEAETEFRGNCRTYESIGDIRELGLAQANLADVLSARFKYDEAEQYYLRSIEIADSLGAKNEAQETHVKLRSMKKKAQDSRKRS